MADPTIDLCNRAIAAAGGRSTIASLDEGSAEARNCKLFIPIATATVLAKGRWSFADVTVAPAAIVPVGALPKQWTYAFAYPLDCIRVRKVVTFNPAAPQVPIFGEQLVAIVAPGQIVPFAIGNNGGQRVIYTNTANIQLSYTTSTSDLSVWEPSASAALEYALAARLAIPLSGDKTLAERLNAKADEAMANAMMADANETVDVRDVPVDWLEVRDGFFANPYDIQR